MSPLVRSCGSLAAIAVAIGALASRGYAKAAETAPDTITVSGEATVTSRPDRVELDLGVVTRAADSQTAAAENAKQLERALGALRKTLGPATELRTISYSLEPDYMPPTRDGGEPKITGYTATNVVRLTLDDLSQLGSVLDVATSSGANQIQRMRFTLQDDDAVRGRAIREAALEARGKAESLANALGLEIAGIRSVVEAGPIPRPMYEMGLARAERAATPIIPGAIETTANVTLTVAVAPRQQRAHRSPR